MDLPTPLTARWRHLLFLNYEVSPELVIPYLPAHTELDPWRDRLYCSVVGLMFLDTAVFGIPDPLHREYEQVNLRFYVRRRVDNGWRHGTVFLKEIVPESLVTVAARMLFNERYVTMEMMHRLVEERDGMLREGSRMEYGWRNGERWNRIGAEVGTEMGMPAEDSREFAVMHRLFGHSKRLDGSTTETSLEHPVWSIRKVKDARLECDIAAIYGEAFVEPLSAPPAFAFVADGSPVSIRTMESI